MKQNMIYRIFAASLLVLLMTACSGFFESKTDDVLSADDYISSQTEVYTGYLGIITKLQAVGDKAIYLTDTRGELLEPTENSLPELIALYNYEPDLTGNEYASPDAFYEVVIACNDYLENMRAFRRARPELVNDERFDALQSLTLRVKVWAYLTLAEIYGQAVWFDDPIVRIQDLTGSTRFQLMDIDQVVDRCIDLLDNGDASTDNINGKLDFSWYQWLDPETALANSQYRYWDYMTPPFEGLMAKLCLWKGAALQGRGDYAGAQPYYQRCADLMLEALNEVISVESYAGNGYFLPTAYIPGRYARFWDNVEPYATEVVCAIIYDYTRNQTNKLLYHFSSEYPNQYLLRPNVAMVEERFETDANNPGYSTGNEARNSVVLGDRDGKPYLAKYRPIGSSRRVNAYQDDVHIYLFRCFEYHFFLVEALNNLGRFEAADAVLNGGLAPTDFLTAGDGSMIKDDDGYGTPKPGFEGFTNDWTSVASWGTRKYNHLGIRGCFSLKDRPVALEYYTEPARRENMKANDMVLLDEAILEFAGEGKIYPLLVRMAKRWGNGSYDASIISSRVAPKYGARAAEMKAKIESQFFVPWDLLLE